MFSYIGQKLKQFCASYLCRFTWFHESGNRFSLELYFLFISSFGFVILHSLDARTTTFTPRNLDLFFTSVSAATVSSMSTVEMEVFSNSQLVVLMILMFIGGELFTSMIVHYIRTFFINVSPKDAQCNFSDKIAELNELNILELGNYPNSKSDQFYMEDLKNKSSKFLSVVVMFYLLFVQFLGVVSVLIYLNVVPSAHDILNNKGLQPFIFSIFTTVSTFANCGFIPTNENMIVFQKNSGLLLIFIVQALLGNTLHPPALRVSLWAVGKFGKKSETSYLLNNSKELAYGHLHSYLHSYLLLVTVLVFIMLQYILFSSMEWTSESLNGLNVYQKLVGILFQTVNTRHAGESIVDFSTVSGAVLVLFILMMYLPAYTSFLPVTTEESSEQKGKSSSGNLMENLVFAQQIYMVIFVILVCITERKQMVEDPLNFSVLNIVFEVISAYGNVGLTTGYSCDRRLRQDGVCENKGYGFSGRWSDQGKLVLIAVMIFGRLKKFNMNGGKTWKVL